MLAAVLAVAGVSATAVADDTPPDGREETTLAKVWVSDWGGRALTEVSVDTIAAVNFGVLGTSTVHTGACEFVFERRGPDEGWAALPSVIVPISAYDTARVVVVGDEYGTFTSEASIMLGVGSYEVTVSYDGDDHWTPAKTGSYEFAVVPSLRSPDPTPDPVPGNPGVETPDPIESIVPIVYPLPDPTLEPDPVKLNPVSSVKVTAGGKTKLTVTMAAPTATLVFNPVDGNVPTGKATFTLQKKSGGKWKTLSTKTVELANGKAKYKLAKATDAAAYRLIVAYSGDIKYNAANAQKAVGIARAKGVVKKAVKVYSAPKASKATRVTLKKGTKVTIVGKNGKFFEVSFWLKGKTKTGFVVRGGVKS
jgi:hypothetical protein